MTKAPSGAPKFNHRREIVLGTYGAGHLGDILCSTPLVRQLKQVYSCDVYLHETALSRAIFANNPYLAGFKSFTGTPLKTIARGHGHLSQRLFQGFELPLEAKPKPDLFFTVDELRWARLQRATWGQGRQICIMLPHALTDRDHLTRVDWTAVGEAIGRHYAVFQPVLSSAGTYQSQGGTLYPGQSWPKQVMLPNARIYRDLPLRQFLALFTIADLYVGGPSGGSHVAAALDIPSINILWDKLCERIRFPVSGGEDLVEKFVYPQHWLVGFEGLVPESGRLRATLDEIVRDIQLRGSAGRDFSTGRCNEKSAGFSPCLPERTITTPTRRILRVPAKYGDFGQPIEQCVTAACAWMER